MKVPIRLQELLQQSEETMRPFLMLIGQGNALLDCTGVEELELEQLDLLFSTIPEEWDFVELGEVIDTGTLTETFAAQL